MNALLAEIRSNAGLETKYITEGIKYFKSSKKLEKLSKLLRKKYNILLKKGDTKNSQELLNFIKKLDTVILKFKNLEDNFKNAKSKEEKNLLKQNYKALEKDYLDLLKTAKKASIRQALIVAGGISIFSIILGLITFGFAQLENQFFIFSNAAENLNLRAQKFEIDKEIAKTNGLGELFGLNKIPELYKKYIDETNPDLIAASAAVGTSSGILTTISFLTNLARIKNKNKIVNDTIEVIKKIKPSKENIETK